MKDVAIRIRTGLVWAAPAVCVALLVAGLAFGRRSDDLPPSLTSPEVLILVPVSIGFAVVGALILSRHPRHRLGWLYVGSAVAMATALFAFPYAWYGLVTAPGAVPAALLVGWLSAWIWTLGFSPAVTFGLLLYPDGRLPSRRWWPAAVVSAAAVIGLALATAFSPGPLTNHPIADNPLGISGAGEIFKVVASVAQPLVLIGFASGVAALIVRWRRAPAGGIERRRISLLALAAGLNLAIVLVPGGTGEVPWTVTVLVLAAASLIPAAIGVAILRHHLYDIDVALNRSLVYGCLTVAVVALYVGLAWLLAQLLGSGSLASILATGLAAAAVLPLRAPLQRVVDRAMYGESGDPYAAVSRLTGQLQAAAAPGEGLAAIADATAVSLRLPYVAVETATGLRAEHGKASGNEQHRLDLVHQGYSVGWLVVEGRRQQALTTRDVALLTDLARPAGAAVYAYGLADALRTSQRRLVEAREEERRRLRRDLHDGLGPTLAGIGLGIDAVTDLIQNDPDLARTILADLKRETTGAVDDVRRLVYDLRPPALDELGLLGAVRQQTERLAARHGGLDIRVEAPQHLANLGAATEVAAYRIAIEAVANAARHGHARHCAVRFATNGMLSVEIVDDGDGIAPGTRPGVGLGAMHERAAELGGECTVYRLTPAGTRVLALLPLDR
jgi:two-component system, NarL family, sensor kinase